MKILNMLTFKISRLGAELARWLAGWLTGSLARWLHGWVGAWVVDGSRVVSAPSFLALSGSVCE